CEPGREAVMECVRRAQLAPFYAGGWGYWRDARREAWEALGDVRGKRWLDYGCGVGQMGIFLALQGAHVWGFDLSPVGVEIANEMAQQLGVKAEFEAMDAEALKYPDRFFDGVISFGVLHHVIKYPSAGHHLHRVLKPGGRAVFVETLWDNPLINFARRFTAQDAAGDAALTEPLILEFARPFSHVRLKKRHLTYMLKRLAKLPVMDLNQPL